MLTLIGRGSLPGAPLHGRTLADHGRDALERLAAARADVAAPVVVEGDPTYDGPGAVLLHDPLCPLVGVGVLAEVLERGLAGDRAVVACRPVTDTLKRVVDGRIEGTVDRDALAVAASPVFVPASRPGPVPMGDIAATVAWLRSWGPVELWTAPASARRVDDAAAVTVLACLAPPADAPPERDPRGR